MIERRSLVCLLWLLGMTVVLPLAARAQTLELIVTFPAQSCVWTGKLFVTNTTIQPGCAVDFEGSTQLARISGGAGCSPTLTGTVSGTLSETMLTFGLVSSEAGTVSFTGTISPGGQIGSGTWSGMPGTGMWTVVSDVDLQSRRASLTVMQPANGCEWSGLIEAAGALTFTGSVNLTRVAGASPECPSTLTGSLAGVLLQPAICFALASAELGNLDFSGTVDLAAQSASGAWSGDPISGTWTGRIGSAVRPAPSLSATSLAVLAGTLLLAGVLSVRRRKRLG